MAAKAAKGKYLRKSLPKLPRKTDLWVTYGDGEVGFPTKSEEEARNLALFFRSQGYAKVRFIIGTSVTLNDYLQGASLDVQAHQRED